MALLTTLASLSQTAASNVADGATDAPSTIDQQVNLLASFIAQLRDGNGLAYASASKQRVINGNFVINQRAAAGAVVLPAGAYGHDRWKAGAAGCSYTFAASGADVVLTISAGSLIQTIEARDVEGGNYCMSWSGTAQGKFAGGAYAASGVTATGVTAAANLSVEFNTGTLTRVQVEPGLVATPYERRLPTLELMLARRFYYRNTNSGTGLIATGLAFAANGAAFCINFPVTMRASPTLGSLNLFPTNGAGTTIAPTGSSILGISSDSALVQINVAGGLTVGQASVLYAGAGAGGYIEFIAEL